jgi:myo-inositol-1(or 4)-monophosphatase
MGRNQQRTKRKGMHDYPEITTTFANNAKRIVAEAAKFIQKERKSFSDDKIELKGVNDLVSYVDRESERRLTQGFTALLPDSGFIREEGGDLRPEADYRWIIDPLDGTTNFIHGVPAYCVSVGLQYMGETIMGIIHDAAHGEVFFTIKGKGAWLDDQPIHVSSHRQLTASLLGTGFPHANGGVMDDYLAAIRAFLASCHGIRRFGSAALDLAYVACGRLDGFFEIGLSSWDVAAGALLVEEAGGCVADFKGGRDFLFGKQIVASNPALQSGMLQVIGKHLAS